MPRSADNTDEMAIAKGTSLERVIKSKASPLFRKSLGWLDSFQPRNRLRNLRLFTDGRLVLGLANGILENAAIDLHPFFGVPVITGSKLKGIAKDAGSLLCKEGSLKGEDFIGIFGEENGDATGSGKAGRVDFLPAFPTSENCRLVLDILTVHYPDYTVPQGCKRSALDCVSKQAPWPPTFG